MRFASRIGGAFTGDDKMKQLLLASVAMAALASVAPVAQASYLSIDDQTDALSLSVDQAANTTTAPNPTPGSGAVIDITTPTPSNGISGIVYNPAAESLSFTFVNHFNWNSNVYFYRYFTEPANEGGGLSDLFVIQGIGGTTPDLVTFISDTDPGTLTGNITQDGPTVPNGVTPVDLGTLGETGDWQLAYNTGPDQYYIRSDIVPEPASLALLGAGLFGVAFARRKRR